MFIRMGKRGDSSDFECRIAVGQKISSERQFCGRKCLAGEWPDWLDLIERQQ